MSSVNPGIQSWIVFAGLRTTHLGFQPFLESPRLTLYFNRNVPVSLHLFCLFLSCLCWFQLPFLLLAPHGPAVSIYLSITQCPLSSVFPGIPSQISTLYALSISYTLESNDYLFFHSTPASFCLQYPTFTSAPVKTLSKALVSLFY